MPIAENAGQSFIPSSKAAYAVALTLRLSQDVLTRLPRMTNHQVPMVILAAWAKALLQLQRQPHHKRHIVSDMTNTTASL
jgi:hypothetical protein